MPERRNHLDDDDALLQFLTRKIENALNDEDGDVSDIRQDNFDRYYGKAYGNERDGRSSFITREVFETIEWSIPNLVRVFMSHEVPASFDPISQDDEASAKEESEIVNHQIQHENNGFLVYYSWFKDVLMNPNSYIKVWAEETTSVETEYFNGVTLQDLQQFEDDPELEIIEADFETKVVPVDEQGNTAEVELASIKVKRVVTKPEIKIKALPPDETLVDDSLNTIDCDEADFVCHRRRISISELVEQGYDYDELASLGSTENNTWNDERVNRLFYEEESPDADEEGEENGAQKKLWVHECSIKYDYDGDNIAERRRVLLIGHEIFENEEDSHQPIVAASSILMPHKHIGMSYAEAMADLQLVTTTLVRQMLDNVYSQTDRRHFFNERALLSDNSTLDDYLDSRSQAIMIRGNPAENVMPEQQTPIINELLEVVRHFQDRNQVRSGVAPTMSLDPDVLKDTTFGAFQGALEEANLRQELLVRLLAETGVKKMYEKVHYLMRRYMNEPVDLKIRNRWVQVTPQEWRQRTKVVANVGMGNNSKGSKLQLLMQLLGLQKEAAMQGLSSAEQLYKTLDELTETAGLGDGSSRFLDPSDPESGYQPPQPPQPSSQDQVFMAQAQALNAETARKQQESQAGIHKDMLELQATMKHEAEKMRQEAEKLALERERFEKQYALDRIKTAVDVDATQTQTRVTAVEADVAELELDDEVRQLDEILEDSHDIENELESDADEQPTDQTPPTE